MKWPHSYYLIKPWLPRSLQLFARRQVANYKKKIFTATWPIDSSASKTPDGWRGWPEEKKFALVLMHDVDSPRGLERIPQLMDLEHQMGFRSAFYLVAEDYHVPVDLRRQLLNTGFEVGIHGLKHDGRLFQNQARFRRLVPRINHYLKDWEAVGFTSPSMLRSFSLMAEMDILYGCSSFDTDPFEPESKGVSTIFPFQVENGHGNKSYIELPYTLPQDHCLFIILREKDTRIWEEKLAWISAQGGLALLITHPDYMNFEARRCSREEYPSSFYRSFLDHIQTKYAGQFWHPLPREMAHFWATGVLRNGSVNDTRSTYSSLSGVTPKRSKIWIDLDNTPHVPFFIPIIRELEKHGHKIVLSGRDAFQVCELSEKKGLPIKSIGHHYGKNRLMKLFGLFRRSAQLYPFLRFHKPDIAVSHGARSQLLLSNIARLPSILIADYEHARTLSITRPKWMIIPEAIPVDRCPVRFQKVRQYPGIKEDVYVSDFDPDPSLLTKLGGKPEDIFITLRPPADEAHYYRPESDLLLYEFMTRLKQTSDVHVIILPRNQHQAQSIKQHYSDLFLNSKTIIPTHAVDGLNLLWYSDLVVSGGGTMNREAAALGVPVYSIFCGKPGAVDQMLERENRLTLVRTAEDVWTKIRIEKRTKHLLPDKEIRPALAKIIFHIGHILEIERAEKQ